MELPIRIELPTMFGMKTVNSYLFKAPIPTLIDCGENTDASWEALSNQLKENGLRISDIERIIITHAHVDHIGMAQRIVDASDCTVWVSPLVWDWAVNLKEMKKLRVEAIESAFSNYVKGDNAFGQMFEAVRNLFEESDTMWLNLDKSSVYQFSLEDKLEIGNRDWSVIHVPGHCQNQTCFYDDTNAEMLSADMILSITPTPVIEYDADVADNRTRGLVKLLKSFDKMRSLDIQKVYPGHYAEMGDPSSLMDIQVSRIQTRLEEAYGFIEKGTSKFSDLLQQLYPNRISMPAANMLIGYLDLLLDEERIYVEDGFISIRK